MLSNAIDFRTRRKHRPKSADFENPEDGQSQSDTRSQCSAGTLPLRESERPGAGRSASVTDLLECVSLSPGQLNISAIGIFQRTETLPTEMFINCSLCHRFMPLCIV